jgi:transmembrane sensor
MAVLAISGAGGWKLAHELGYDATWRSGIGELGSATLADGSALRFDAGTRIDLANAVARVDHVDAASRIDAGTGGGPIRLQLRQGQLLVRARGPLTVTVGGAEIDCDGAELCAGRLGRRGIVAVRGGNAVLRAEGFAPVALAAGDTFTFDRTGAVASPLSFNAAAGWTRGMLVADRLPLPDLAEAFGRYHRGIVRVTGAAARQAISGVFRLADLEGALRQVAGALPVRVARFGMLTIVE